MGSAAFAMSSWQTWRRQWYPLQDSCLENPMDRGAWWVAVHGVTKSQTQLSDFTFTFHFHALEKEMATHSSVLAWRIPGTAEPGGLLSLGSHRVGHNWSDLAAAAAAAAWETREEMATRHNRLPAVCNCVLLIACFHSKPIWKQIWNQLTLSFFSNLL